MFPVSKTYVTKVFNVKPPSSFLLPISFEILTAGCSSWIFIIPPVRWLKKSDYSSLP